jgi:hypothetical protein
MLVLCLCHIVGTAIGTGAGRVDFGLTQALASRYVTPALMGWGALFVLIIPVFDEAVARRGGRALWPWMALALLMIPSQLAALESRESQRFERRVAMLALELGVGDWLQIRQVHPNPGEALEIADWASDRDVGVFGIPPFAGLQEQLGGSISQLPTARCHGRVNHVYPVGEKDGIVRVNGWIFDKKKRAVPDLVRFCDEDGSVIGFALTGRERPRIAARLGEEAERSGFTGYIRRDDSSGKVLAVAEDPECAVWMKY